MKPSLPIEIFIKPNVYEPLRELIKDFEHKVWFGKGIAEVVRKA